jgi:hypothetical protein
MCSNIEFIAQQVQEHYDVDPVYFLEDEACIMFDQTPVFVKRFEDHFVLEIEGEEYEVPRI